MSAAPISINRQLVRMSMPIIGLNVLNVLMLAVDSALCGRMPDSKHVLAALGYATQVIFLLMVAMLGLLVGTVALVARAYGAGDTKRLDHLLAQATQLTALVGVVVGIVGAVLAGPILRALGASHDVAAIGVAYLRPLMIGTPFFYLGLLYAGILRGVGNTRLPFICALGANVVNAVLNYALILGNLGMPALGVTGSAIGTVIAQFLNCLALAWLLRRGSIPNVRLPLRIARVDRSLAVELLRIGWPAAIDMFILNAGFLTALGILGRIDETSVAAHGLGLRVQSLAFVPGMGVAQASAAMIGQALGAANVERARQIARAAIVLCVVIMTALAIIIVFAAHPLVATFDVPPHTPLEEYAVEWMRILAYAMLPAAVNIALVGVLQGSGATRISLRINIWTTLALQVPLAALLGLGLDMGATGVWLSFPLSFVAKAAMSYLAFKQGSWAVTGVRIPANPVTSVEH